MGIVTPRPPGEEHFAFDAPPLAVAQGNFHLDVRGYDSPEQQIGLDCPMFLVVNVDFRIGYGQIDDGVADDNGVFPCRCWYFGHHGGARTAEVREVSFRQLMPHTPALELAELLLSLVAIPGVVRGPVLQNTEYVVAPRLLTLFHLII